MCDNNFPFQKSHKAFKKSRNPTSGSVERSSINRKSCPRAPKEGTCSEGGSGWPARLPCSCCPFNPAQPSWSSHQSSEKQFKEGNRELKNKMKRIKVSVCMYLQYYRIGQCLMSPAPFFLFYLFTLLPPLFFLGGLED